MRKSADGSITEGLATVLPIETNEVFYNPAQVFNRDLSILAISVFARESMEGGLLAPKKRSLPSTETPVTRVLEGLAASGLRSIRYVKELQFGQFDVTVNDIESIAVERIGKNLVHNGLADNSNVRAVNSDAILHMHLNKGLYDVIDLDPYGSCSMFLDSALGSVKPNGLLCITSTDGGVLCGNQTDLAYIRYGGFAVKENYSHEMGLRVMLHAIASAAARHKRGIKVLAAFSIDFYFRVFVQVIDSAELALGALSNTGLVYQCCQCEFHHIQPLARIEGKNRKPARLTAPNVCTQCDSQLAIGGPMWTGPLYDESFVDKCLCAVEDEQDSFPGISVWAKIKGLFFGLKSELVDVPLFYTIPGLTAAVKVSPPKLKLFYFWLRELGFRVGGSHRTTNAVKTDAPAHVVFDLLRLYVESLPNRDAIKPMLPQILAKPITLEIPAGMEIDWSMKVEDKANRVPIYLPNPTANWGPKPRAVTGSNDAKKLRTDNEQ